MKKKVERYLYVFISSLLLISCTSIRKPLDLNSVKSINPPSWVLGTWMSEPENLYNSAVLYGKTIKFFISIDEKEALLLAIPQYIVNGNLEEGVNSETGCHEIVPLSESFHKNEYCIRVDTIDGTVIFLSFILQGNTNSTGDQLMFFITTKDGIEIGNVSMIKISESSL